MVKDQFKWRCEFVYYVTLFIYLILLFIPQTELRVSISSTVDKLLQIARYGCYLLFVLKIAMTHFYRRSFLLSALFCFACIMLCVLMSSQNKLLFFTMAIIAAYDCDAYRTLNTATIAYTLGLCVTLLLCAVGVFQNQILDASRGRYNLGFNWVTLAPIYFLFISMGYTIWRDEKITWIEIILLELFAVLLYKATDTRLAFLINTVYLLIILVQRCIFKFSWHILHSLGIWVCALPAAVFLGVLVVQILYTPGSPMWDQLNSMLSGRLSLGEKNFNALPVTLFGQVIEWKGFSLGEGLLTIDETYAYNNVDCSYLRILFDYGVVGLLLTLWVYTLGIYHAFKENASLLVWAYMIVLVFCITEQWMMELAFNPLPLLALAEVKQRNILQQAAERRTKIIFHHG